MRLLTVLVVIGILLLLCQLQLFHFLLNLRHVCLDLFDIGLDLLDIGLDLLECFVVPQELLSCSANFRKTASTSAFNVATSALKV